LPIRHHLEVFLLLLVEFDLEAATPFGLDLVIEDQDFKGFLLSALVEKHVTRSAVGLTHEAHPLVVAEALPL